MIIKIIKTTEWFVDIGNDSELSTEIEQGKDVDLESLVDGKEEFANKVSFKAKFVANKVLTSSSKQSKIIGFKDNV